MKKPISVHVDEENYEELKSMASRQGRPVAMLVREAMADYLVRERRTGSRFVDIPPRSLGRRLRPWSREEIYEEMYDERAAQRPEAANPTR